MSIKKAISLSFLLLANVAILVHVFVFHHHDSQLPAVFCTETQKYHNCDGNTGQHNCPETQNAHNCCTVENCLLNDSITKSDDFKIIEPIVNNLYIITNNALACKTFQITDLEGLPFRQKPYLPSCHLQYISQSLGLRAPPVC